MPAGAAVAAGTAKAGAAGLPKAAARQGLSGGSEGTREKLRKLLYALLGLVGLGLLLVVVLLVSVVLLFRAVFFGQGDWGYPAGTGVPKVYWPMYTTAAGHYKVNPYVLAAIHRHETGFSTSRLPGVRSAWNGCGAAGPMQFGIVGVRPYNGTVPSCPGNPAGAGPTWAGYADAAAPLEGSRPASYPLSRHTLSSCRRVPADVGCVYDDFDAIAGAAKKLKAGGADKHVDSYGTREAILAYNRSQVYLSAILADARAWEAKGATTENPFVGGNGRVVIAPGANRAGVSMKRPILDFLRLVADNYGGKIVVTTGTNHDKLTTNDTVSNHWGGFAADLGMVANGGTNDGPVGDRIAAAALQAAGVPAIQAISCARRGGLFNVNSDGWRVQVIWGVGGDKNGGNHHDHVHIGLSRNLWKGPTHTC